LELALQGRRREVGAAGEWATRRTYSEARRWPTCGPAKEEAAGELVGGLAEEHAMGRLADLEAQPCPNLLPSRCHL
jgi:hypothetical protein